MNDRKRPTGDAEFRRTKRPKVSLWTNHVMVNNHWLDNLDRLGGSLLSLDFDVEVMVSMGRLNGDGLGQGGPSPTYPPEGARQAIFELRKRGLRVVPACVMPQEPSDDSSQWGSWFDSKTWDSVLDDLDGLAAERHGDLRIAIDMEPYWPEPRYPRRTYPVKGDWPKFPPYDEYGEVAWSDPGKDEYKLAGAMAPFVAKLREKNIVPMILPGGFGYAASDLLISAIPETIVMDEGTYQMPLRWGHSTEWPKYWDLYGLRKQAFSVLGREYKPGFYAAALRRSLAGRSFMDHIQELGVYPFWCYFRDPEDDPEGFFSPEWFSKPYMEPTPPGIELPPPPCY